LIKDKGYEKTRKKVLDKYPIKLKETRQISVESDKKKTLKKSGKQSGTKMTVNAPKILSTTATLAQMVPSKTVVEVIRVACPEMEANRKKQSMISREKIIKERQTQGNSGVGSFVRAQNITEVTQGKLFF
jgi:hypothetical protein